MAYFNTKQTKYRPRPIPPIPPYVPPVPPVPPVPESGSDPVIPRPPFSGVTPIKFYNTASENAAVNKILFNEVTYYIVFKEDTSVDNPIIVIDSEIDLSNYNYAYIPSLNRYYYKGECVLLTGGYYELQLHSDPLMSFKEGVLNIEGIIDKAEAGGNLYINDGSWKTQSNEFIEIKNFSNGFNDSGEFILITAGG